MNQARKGFSILLVLCVLGFGLTIRQAWAAAIEHEEDDEAGFSGYMWGAAPSDCPPLTRIRELGSTDYAHKAEVYTNPDEGLTLNGASLRAINYRFVDDQLESVEVKYEGRENRESLLRWVEERYGRLAGHERRIVTHVEWVGERTGITLAYDPRTKHGTLWFFSLPLHHLYYDFFPGSRV